MEAGKMIVFISPNLEEKYPDICDLAGQIWNTWMNPLQMSGCGLFAKWYVDNEPCQKVEGAWIVLGNLQYGIFDKLLLHSKRLTNLR